MRHVAVQVIPEGQLYFMRTRKGVPVNTSSKIYTRPASSSDQEFIVSLLSRLEEFGPPGSEGQAA